MARQTGSKNKYNQHLRIINGGPFDMAELVGVMEPLSEHLLARCWVALMVDNLLTFGEPPLGAFTAALNHVNQRLHGVKVNEPQIQTQHWEQRVMANLRQKQIGEKLDDGLVVREEGLEVRCDTAPAPKPRGFSGMVKQHIRKLKPGQYITVDPEKMKKGAIGTIISVLKKNEGLSETITCYESEDGEIVVKYPPAAQKAEPKISNLKGGGAF